MVEDSRSSSVSESNALLVGAGNAAPIRAVPMKPEQTLAIGMVRIDYPNSAGTEASVELHDYEVEEDDQGNITTVAEDLDDLVDKFNVQPGDTVLLEDPNYEDVENELVALPDGNQDAEMVVTVGGPLLTS